MIDWKLLRDPFFLLVTLGNSLSWCVMLSYIPGLRTICKERGLSVPQTTDILTLISTTEVFTRAFQGFLSDRACLRNSFRHPKKVVFTVMSLGMSITLIGVTFAADFLSLAISTCVCSLFSSAIMVNGPLIYAECFPNNLSSAIGISNLFRGGLAIIIGVSVGMLSDHFGTFNAALVFLSGSTASVMGLWLVMDFINFCRSRS